MGKKAERRKAMAKKREDYLATEKRIGLEAIKNGGKKTIYKVKKG